MKLLFDINHPADVNFFKNAIFRLKNRKHSITIMYRDRGKLESILKYELNGFKIIRIGDHKKGFISKLIGQLNRDFHLISFFKKNNFDLCVCFGPTSVISSRISGVPYLAFDDDFEYKIPFYHANIFASKHIYPDFISYSSSNTIKYKGFKELAYLQPEYLNLSTDVLKEYELVENEYVFIREISNISLNYNENNSILTDLIPELIRRNLKVLVSLENDEIKKALPIECIFLKEPVSDLYSLINYSLFAISSGDSVAREASLLGVPSIYTGGRKMLMNDPLVNKGLMFESQDLESVIKIVSQLNVNTKIVNQNKIKDLIGIEWEDTTALIIKEILNYE